MLAAKGIIISRGRGGLKGRTIRLERENTVTADTGVTSDTESGDSTVSDGDGISTEDIVGVVESTPDQIGGDGSDGDDGNSEERGPLPLDSFQSTSQESHGRIESRKDAY